MVIDDGDFGGAGVGPFEDDSPLIVDADGVEAFQIPLEGFEAITGRHGHVGRLASLIELNELSEGDAGDIAKGAALFSKEKLFGLGTVEGLDHDA